MTVNPNIVFTAGTAAEWRRIVFGDNGEAVTIGGNPTFSGYISITSDPVANPVGLNGKIRVPWTVTGSFTDQIIVGRNNANTGDKIYLAGNSSLTDDVALGDGDFRTSLLGHGVYVMGSPLTPGGVPWLYFSNAIAGNPALRSSGTVLGVRLGDNSADGDFSCRILTASGAISGTSGAFTANVTNTVGGVASYTATSSVNGAGVFFTAVGKNSGGTARTARMGLNEFADDVLSLSDGTVERLRVNLTNSNVTFGNNLLVGGSIGATAAKTIALSNSATAPTTTVDLCHVYALDISAGNASLALFQEQAPNAAVDVASTHRLPITINGTQYAILLTTVLS